MEAHGANEKISRHDADDPGRGDAMIIAGTRPPDRAARARARAARAAQAELAGPAEPSTGPPAVGQQRAGAQAETQEPAVEADPRPDVPAGPPDSAAELPSPRR